MKHNRSKAPSVINLLLQLLHPLQSLSQRQSVANVAIVAASRCWFCCKSLVLRNAKRSNFWSRKGPRQGVSRPAESSTPSANASKVLGVSWGARQIGAGQTEALIGMGIPDPRNLPNDFDKNGEG